MVEDLKEGGVFLLNCSWNDKELDANLPGSMKRYIAKNKISLYTIDATHIAVELGLGGRVNTILQAAFFNLTGIIKGDKIIKLMKDAATKSFSKKGEKIVAMNHAAIDRGFTGTVKVEVPAAWAKAKDVVTETTVETDRADLKKFVTDVLHPVNAQLGDKLPVSTFAHVADGTFPQGSAAFEKRGIAVDVPTWTPENCIQCNYCSYVCPHAVIRPFALTDEEAAKAPEGMKLKPMNGVPGMQFSIAISSLDCYGCGSCANVCPGMKGNKALVMNPLATQLPEQLNFNYALSLPEKPEVGVKFPDSSVKGSQFKTPLLEFSGACAGCGETPYAKLVTQLFGERMYIANATGCSSIWGGSAPSTPYTVNKQGKGPAWANSLFEDNAEYGYGMMLANDQIRGRLAVSVAALANCDGCTDKAVIDAANAWLETKENGDLNGAASDTLLKAVKAAKFKKDCCNEAVAAILNDSDYLAKKSIWVFGGDGWAYDIGFGGLDHVIAQNENINLLVFDTEVYSNTGGQASKSTPTGAIAKFAAAGKTVKKKDLAQIAMSYGYVYVAQVAMGADYNQCIKAFKEAESYDGPSIIIAYAPCINHGIKGGMGISMTEEKAAVAAGYWHNYRYDPRLIEQGKNPFSLDSKAPSESYRDFIMNEVRYSSLFSALPAGAEALLSRSEDDAKSKYDKLVRLKEMYKPADEV